MKHSFLPLLAAATLLAACGGATEQPAASDPQSGDAVETKLGDGIYVINKVKPKVTWAAQKLTGEGHNGTLHIESGKFKMDGGQVTEGMVVFDMARMEVSDLTGEDKASLEDHLQSGDFFNVETYPKAVLNVSGISEEGGQATLAATLTMNGKAADYSIPVTVVEADVPGNLKGLAIQGKFLLDRTKHDITYRSKTFDDKLDWFIKDEVEVGFSVIGVPAM